MHRLELDHLFSFVEPEFVGSLELAAVGEFGLNLEFGRVHHGQGTANRLALFPDSSVEFLWLANRGEAQGNALRLDRRVDARAGGGSPFGVCLRGRLDPAVREAWFWSYTLPGTALDSIAIARVSEDLRWPMLFVFDTQIDTRPRSLGYPAKLFEHQNRATGIARARLKSIGDFAAALGPIAELLPDQLELESADMHRLEVALDATGPGRVEVGPLLLSCQ